MSNDDPKFPNSSARSVNPFAQSSEPAKGLPKQSTNPFAAAGGGGSLNPFAQAQGSAATSGNPFSSASQATEGPAPTQSQNPFAAQSVGTASPLSLQTNMPEGGPRSISGMMPPAGSASVNPFQQGGALPSALDRVGGGDPAAAFAADPAAAFASSPGPGFGGYSDQEADQMRKLAPLAFSPVDYSSEEFEMPPDLTAGLVRRQLVFTIAGGAAAGALIIGLLIGIMLDQRSEHNYRVDSWADIDDALVKPLEQIDQIDELIKQSLTKATIDWTLIESLPEDLKPISPALVVGRVSLQRSAALKLSKLIHETNKLFSDILNHRLLTLASRGELDTKGERRPFESYKYYAVDMSDFFSSCVKQGKLNCRLPEIGKIPQGRIVAVHGEKGKKVTVAIRHETELFTVDPSYLVPLKKDQVTGFGSTPAQAYAIRLKALKEHLENLRQTKMAFQETLKEKLAIQKVFAL